MNETKSPAAVADNQAEINDAVRQKIAVLSCVSALRDEDGRTKTRELALAVTKLQEASMWIDEHIRLIGGLDQGAMVAAIETMGNACKAAHHAISSLLADREGISDDLLLDVQQGCGRGITQATAALKRPVC